MSKPSIFSKEYERKMKRRKRNTIAILVLIIVVVSAVAIKFTYAPIDFSNIRQNIQAWIDSDTSSIPQETVQNAGESTSEEVSSEEVSSEEEVAEEEKEHEEQFMDISLVSGNSAKAVYIEDENGQKVFKELQGADEGVTYDIRRDKTQMLVCDTNAQITLYNIDGSSKIISKDQYVSKSGGVFTKEATLASQPQYLWNVNPKFLNEESIIFVTNRPYFGTAAVKQYLWITNYNNGTDTILWQIQGTKAEIGSKEEKGVAVTVDGASYYIGQDGVITQ